MADQRRTYGTGHMTILDGDGMSADDAAWASIADAAERALMLPGLSDRCASLMVEMRASCRECAGLPPLQHQAPSTTHTPMEVL